VRFVKIAIALIVVTALAGPVMAQESNCRTQQCFVQSAKIHYKVYKKTKLRSDLYHCIDLLKEASSMFPHHPELYYYLGTFYAEINAIDTMIAYFDSTTMYCDDESIDKSQRHNCYKGDKYVEKMKKLREDIWERTYNDGVNYMQQYDTVQAMLERASADNQDSIKTLDSLKQAAFNLAKKSFKQALLAKPSEELSYDALAVLYERDKNYQEAINIYTKAIDLMGEDSALTSRLAYAYISVPDWENAIKYFKKYLTYAPDDVNALINLSVAYNAISDYDKWYEYLAKALKLQPDNTQLLFNSGQYWFLKMQEANDSLTTITDSTGEAKERRKVIETQVVADRDSAIVSFERVVELNPEDTDALKRLGILYLIATQTEKAADVFEKYLQIDPNDIIALDYLSRAYIILGETPKAIPPLEKIVEMDPGNLDAWQRLAELYEYNGMPDKAKQAQAKAEELKNM
jgi:tetratricopeptide (TPR) repeat protein